jgi:hypothetical protein
LHINREGEQHPYVPNKQLMDLGVANGDWPNFKNGEWVPFEFPTTGGDPVYGFVRFADSQLTSQLFSISNPSPGPAGRAFLQFRTKTFALGRALGLAEVEFQGGSVINPKLQLWLANQGFAVKSEIAPSSVGNSAQDVFWKTVKIPAGKP